jgi:hypothetical protein
MKRRVRIVVIDEIEWIVGTYQRRQVKFIKSLIALLYLFCFREKIRAKIHLLLSLRYGVSPSAKEVGR